MTKRINYRAGTRFFYAPKPMLKLPNFPLQAVLLEIKFVLQCKTFYICFMPTDKENKTVNINLRVTEGIKKSLERLAENDQRSLSDYIRLQLEKLVETSKKK